MNKKYELTDETMQYSGITLHRIRALRNFGDVHKGDLGGFVESEDNLSHEDNCWIYNEGKVFGNGKVIENGMVFDYGRVSEYGEVSGHGVVSGHGEVFGYGTVFGSGEVIDNGKVYDHGTVYNNGTVVDNGAVCGYAVIKGDAVVGEIDDYLVFKNTWSSGKYFTWTKSNNMWSVGCFYGTGEELIKKAYEESQESGKKYESYVKLVEDNFL